MQQLRSVVHVIIFLRSVLSFLLIELRLIIMDFPPVRIHGFRRSCKTRNDCDPVQIQLMKVVDVKIMSTNEYRCEQIFFQLVSPWQSIPHFRRHLYLACSNAVTTGED